MNWFKRAFAVDDGPAEPTPEQQRAVDWFCQQVARRHLTTPGLIGLEMTRPLNFIVSQTMHFFGPGVWSLVPQKTYDDYVRFAAFLEKRGSIDYLCRRIEHFEEQFERESSARQSDPGSDTDPTDDHAEP